MLIAGCYERFLFGYKQNDDASAQPSTLSRTFSYAAHKGAVKCLTTAAGLVASGGTDDLIHLYDIQRACDLGFLMNPGDGAVTALDFHVPAGAGSPSHLLNGSSDGTLSVWQGGTWECLKHMEGHKGEVNDLSVHPSGSVALSVGRDRELRIWNLVKGRVTYHSRLACEASAVAFASDGTSYALVCGRDASLHSAEGSGLQLADMPHPTKVQSSAFYGPYGLLTGCEDGSLRLWDSRCSRVAVEVQRAHATRIRGITATGAAHPGTSAAGPAAAENSNTRGGSSDDEAVEDGKGPEQSALARLLMCSGGTAVVASASTDGMLRLWDLRNSGDNRLLGEASTSARLTCLSWMPSMSARQPHSTTQPARSKKASTDLGVKGSKAGLKTQTKSTPAGAVDDSKQRGSKPEVQEPILKAPRTRDTKNPSLPRQPAAPKLQPQKTLKKESRGGCDIDEAELSKEQTHSAGRKAKRKQKAAEAAAEAAQIKDTKAKEKPKHSQLEEQPEKDRGIKRKGVVEFKSTAEDDMADIPGAVLEGNIVSAEHVRRLKMGSKAGRGLNPKTRSIAAISLDRFD